jgi:hypothetical protein
MKINDIFAEMGIHFAGDYTASLKEKEPEKFDQITRLLNNMSEIALQVLQTDAEFRLNFARIHAEFLKYPESRQVIEASINSFGQYKGLQS